MLIGLAIAWNNYIRNPAAAGALRRAASGGVTASCSNKWYFDELYDRIFVRPALWLGRLFWKRGDEGTIDRFGPHGAAYAVGVGNRITARLQSGYLYTYALVMLLGLIGAATWAIWWAASERLPVAHPADRRAADRRRALPVRRGRRRALDRAGRDADRPRARRLPLGRVRSRRRAMAVRREARRSAAASAGRSASTASRCADHADRCS